jgi:hypothetical protein
MGAALKLWALLEAGEVYQADTLFTFHHIPLASRSYIPLAIRHFSPSYDSVGLLIYFLKQPGPTLLLMNAPRGSTHKAQTHR